MGIKKKMRETFPPCSGGLNDYNSSPSEDTQKIWLTNNSFIITSDSQQLRRASQGEDREWAPHLGPSEPQG